MTKASSKRAPAKKTARRTNAKTSTPADGAGSPHATTNQPSGQSPAAGGSPDAPAQPPVPPDPHAWRVIDRDQLAELLGVHPDSISDFTREGMPVETRGGRGAKSVYDAVRCLAWWRRNKTELSAKDAAQARALAATAEVNELRAAEKKGELISREEVVREGQAYTKAWATKVQGLARQLLLAGIITRDQEAKITAACRDLLTDIASWQTVADTTAAAAAESAA